jgi:hypothetical protein
MKHMKFLSLICALLLVFLAGGFSVLAQSTTGTIAGIIADERQAVIQGATVTIQNLETNATRSVVTDSEGRFRFTGLPVGRYELTVEQTGFAKFVRGPITLNVNQVAVLEIEMKAAQVQEVVTVTADVTLLNKANAEVGVRFDPRRISELPLAPNRNVLNLALFAAGVSQLSSGNSTFTTGGVSFSVNGMRTRSNNFMVDGQDSNDPSITGLQQPFNNPDIVQEFRLITNQPAAEFGRAAGSVVNIITKSGSNSFHGSAFVFNNNTALNSRSNLQKRTSTDTPFRDETQAGGTLGGPILKDRTFFFGSFQRWRDRQLGSGNTINGVPTEQGRQLLQPLAATRPQLQALLTFLPAAQTPLGRNVAVTAGGQTLQIPVGSLTGSTSQRFGNYQWSGRVDHRFSANHSLGGRYLYNDQLTSGGGQVTPPGLTTVVPTRQQAATAYATNVLTPRLLNEFRFSYQRLGTTTTAADTSSETIPSIEVPELGLTGFNAAVSRTAIGLAVNLPQFRFNNTYQIQETLSYTRGAHAIKTGLDFRRVDVKSFFIPTTRGLLRYPTLQRLVDDNAEAANKNAPLPGGQTLLYAKYYDYYAFVQDEWRVTSNFSLNFGLRYETPGNSYDSLLPINERIIAANGNDQRFALTPVPERDKNNFQPRFGFSWNPRTESGSWMSWLTGGDRLVVRGGYARTNDYQFLNILLNTWSAFPFVAAINNSNLQNAFTVLPTLGFNPATNVNLLTRTIVGADFRAPYADQYTLEIQRELTNDTVFRVGYVATKGTALFQTIDGNPALPRTASSQPLVRVDPTQGVRRLRANAVSSIYHSMQMSLERRLSRGVSFGAHYTWSAYIDDASEIFNPSVSGEIAVSQDSFNRRADRGRSTYDRPHRFSVNAVYDLPIFTTQTGFAGRVLGGWQVNAFITLQSGAPFTPLNGSDPTGALAGIDGLVGNAIRPNPNTNLDVSSMTVEELLRAGGRSLFATLTGGQRVGIAGRNILRADGIQNLDFGIIKNTRITENHLIQFRAEFYNATNTRNFGIPTAQVNSTNFLNQWGTDGGNRRVILGLRYTF